MGKFKKQTENIDCVCIYKETQKNNCNISKSDKFIIFRTKDIELIIEKEKLLNFLED